MDKQIRTVPGKKRQRRPSDHILAEVILAKWGIVSSVAQTIGVTSHTVRKWRDTDPSVAEMFNEAKERLLDLAELVIMKKIYEGDLRAAIFYLTCHGKKRGYNIPDRNPSWGEGKYFERLQEKIKENAWQNKMKLTVRKIRENALYPLDTLVTNRS